MTTKNINVKRLHWIIFIVFAIFGFYSLSSFFDLEILIFSNKTKINFFRNNMSYTNETKNTEFHKLMQQEFRQMNFFDVETKHGLLFDKKWNVYLNDLSLLDVKHIDDEAVLKSVPIIGTALSSNHFEEFLNLLESLVRVYGNQSKNTMYIYDLGLSAREKKMLLAGYSNIIKEIRNFQFEKYPPYFTKLIAFRWKPVIVAELLKEFPSIWWMDASIQVYKPLEVFYPDIRRCSSNVRGCEIYPWSLINDEGLSIWAGTDNRTFDYFPMNQEVAKNFTMYGASVQLIFATKDVREQVLRYWVLCALEEECMDPKGSHTGCRWNGYYVFQGGDTYRVHGGCNLQDQSVINIILARVSNFNVTRYYRNVKGTVEVRRKFCL